MRTNLMLALLVALGASACGYPSIFLLADGAVSADGSDGASDAPVTPGDGNDVVVPDVPTQDGATCTDTQNDPNNCGSCGSVCAPDPSSAGRAACVAGNCSFGCGMGFQLASGRCDVIPPRAIAPLGFATVTSPFPVFAWELPPGVVGGEIEVSRTLDFASPTTVAIPTASAGSLPSPLAAGRWFYRIHGIDMHGTIGRAGSIVRWFVVQTGTAQLTTAMRSVFGQQCDFNNDGFIDVVASGASGANGTVGVSAGAATWSATGSPLHLIRYNIMLANADVGHSVACAGDVNGDGYGDLLVGAPQAFGAGEVLVFHGTAGGIADGQMPTGGAGNPGPAAMGLTGWSVAGAGDLDGDGYADIVVGTSNDTAANNDGDAYVYFGSATGLILTGVRLPHTPGLGNSFGSTVAGVGDVNGDGVWDIAVTEPGAMASFGHVWIYSGHRDRSLFATTPAFHSVDGYVMGGSHGMTSVYTGVGSSVAPAGDFDGDGLADVLIGSSGSGGEVRFASFAVPGNMTGAVVPSGLGSLTRVGTAIGLMGDMDGDGLSEALMGDPANSRVYLVRPGRTVVTYQFSVDANYGEAVAAGDVNGDGRPDLIAGAPNVTNPTSGSGSLIVHIVTRAPPPGGMVTVFPSEGILGPGGFGSFGRAVAWLPLVPAMPSRWRGLFDAAAAL